MILYSNINVFCSLYLFFCYIIILALIIVMMELWVPRPSPPPCMWMTSYSLPKPIRIAMT